MSGLPRNLLNTISVFYKYAKNTKYSYQIIRLLSSKEVGCVKSIINQDILLHNLKSVSNTQNLLDIISIHHKIMNNAHLTQAFKTLFNLQKKENSLEDIKEHSTFKTLCLLLKSNVRSIDTNELIETLKVLSFVGVPSNNKIIQIILQMIRQDINNLNLQQIIFLDFLLKQFKSTPLSDALLIAFPIVFEIQLPLKINHNNLSHLTDLLQYAAKKKLSESSISLLLETIAANKEINTKAAVSIVWSLCELKPNDSYGPIFKKLLKIVIKDDSNITISDLETTLTKLVLKFNKNHQYYYNKEFFNMIAEHVITNDLGFQQTIWILRKFSRVGFSHNGLLDYFSKLCYNDKRLIRNIDSQSMCNLITAFASTNYRPIYWESVKQEILENKHLLGGLRQIDHIKLATRLAILDIFISDVLQKSLEENYINELILNGPFACLEYFLILYQTVSTLKPEYNHLLPNISYVNKALTKTYLSIVEKHQDRPLQSILEKGFGGEDYVLPNVITKLGHLLHHVVVMRKGGFPVAFKKAEQKLPLVLEELQIPVDSHVVSIFGCDSSYYRTDNIFRSIYTLMFRTIEACGYSVIPVSLEIWNHLSDHEKIPYLMQIIRIKNEEFEKLLIAQ